MLTYDYVHTRKDHRQMFIKENFLILPYALDTLRYLSRCHWWAAIGKKEALVLNLLTIRKHI